MGLGVALLSVLGLATALLGRGVDGALLQFLHAILTRGLSDKAVEGRVEALAVAEADMAEISSMLVFW